MEKILNNLIFSFICIFALAACLNSPSDDTLENLNILAQKNQAASDSFLLANSKKPDVVVLPSGLQYKIINSGTGIKPRLTDSILVNYEGSRAVDGYVFDSSIRRKRPDKFKLNQLIMGWTEALPMMQQGSKWILYIPPYLAYGERGTGTNIGPNVALVFEIELLEVKRQ